MMPQALLSIYNKVKVKRKVKLSRSFEKYILFHEHCQIHLTAKKTYIVIEYV